MIFFIRIKVYEIVFAYNCVLNCAGGCARRKKKGMTADFMHELDLVHLRNCKQDMHMIYERQTFIAVFLVFTSTHMPNTIQQEKSPHSLTYYERFSVGHTKSDYVSKIEIFNILWLIWENYLPLVPINNDPNLCRNTEESLG